MNSAMDLCMKELIYSMYRLNSYDIQSKLNGMVKLSDNNDQQIKKHVKCKQSPILIR